MSVTLIIFRSGGGEGRIRTRKRGWFLALGRAVGRNLRSYRGPCVCMHVPPPCMVPNHRGRAKGKASVNAAHLGKAGPATRKAKPLQKQVAARPPAHHHCMDMLVHWGMRVSPHSLTSQIIQCMRYAMCLREENGPNEWLAIAQRSRQGNTSTMEETG